MINKRTAFFISDRTGITVEKLGRSLLSQFEDMDFARITLPFVDSADKARAVLQQINEVTRTTGNRPIVFSTLTMPELHDIIRQSDALVLDLFERFIAPLELELGVASSHAVGRSHAAGPNYSERMDAVNYALNHDDGGVTRDLARADIVLVGVSRCGKSPTSLYLALQFGIYAANYPLVPEDFARNALPEPLLPLAGKLYGLTIQPERLAQIRAERMPDSRYASLDNCRAEVSQAEQLMRSANIPILDVSAISVEEIATTLLHLAGLRR